MPIYEFRCKQCGNEFESWQNSFSESKKTRCPKCNGRVSRLISSSSFILKGTGWYATDYGNKTLDKKIEKIESKKTTSTQSSV
jgi:putative FmdB family regulatory protein